MNVDHTTSNLIVKVLILDDNGDPLSGLLHSSVGLSARFKLQTSIDWTPIPLVIGSPTQYVLGGFVESADRGYYYFGFPNAGLVPGTTTELAFDIPNAQPLLDSLYVTGGGSFTGVGYVSNSIRHETLVRYVCQYLGFRSTGYRDLAATEARQVDGILAEGMREFYFPSEQSHNWSFLQKRETLNLVPGRIWYPLAGDFIRFASSITTTLGQPIATVTESDVTLRHANAPLVGRPVYATIRSLSESHQSYEIGVYPSPDQARQVNFSYLFDPGGVSELSPTPRGGPRHSSTVVASCLAAAERLMNPETMAEGGIQQAMFQQKLAASIKSDQLILQGQGV
jgi:hypothetical protein